MLTITPMADAVHDSWRNRLEELTDERFRELLQASRPYTVVILKAGPQRRMDGVDRIVWKHGRRNMSLRLAGLLSIVCAIRDGSDVSGVGVFHAEPEVVREIMSEDPGVKMGVFTFEIHPASSFPGDALPS